jgi:putative ABC transport system substrate-binding protein
LTELGHVEGRDIVYAARYAETRRERLPGLVAELLDFKPDVFVAFHNPSAEAARSATKTVPIVFAGAGDAVAIGLISTLSRPGGNITGITEPAGELSAKRLELLKEAVPNAKRVAVLWNAADRAMTLRYQEIERAAERLGIVCQPLGCASRTISTRPSRRCSAMRRTGCSSSPML